MSREMIRLEMRRCCNVEEVPFGSMNVLIAVNAVDEVDAINAGQV